MTAILGVTILFRANSHVILTLPYIWGMAGRESCAGASGAPGGAGCAGRGRALRVVRVCAGVGVPCVPGGAGWYGSPMRTLHIDQGIYYNRKKKEKHEKRAEPAEL